jgi:GDP-L-fucose synthase
VSAGRERVFVAGHRGMVGAAIVAALSEQNSAELILATRDELDLREGAAVRAYVARMRPMQIYLAAATVGGILANDTRPAEFIADNLAIALNVIDAAHRADVPRLLFLGSSCIYPRLATQPMREEALLTGALEPTNEPYAIAKIAGIKLCESYRRQYGRDYRSLMPTNLYGPGDNFHPTASHVIPALIRRFHEAKRAQAPCVSVWGSGAPRREFLDVRDLARACCFVMNLDRAQYEGATQTRCTHLNVGTGSDVRIAELAQLVARVVGYGGRIEFDASKPDGAPRKLLDVGRLHALGWRAQIDLETGLRDAYAWFLGQHGRARGQDIDEHA